MKKIFCVCLVLYAFGSELAAQEPADVHHDAVVAWLEAFPYTWSNRAFDPALLSTPSVLAIQPHLRALGLSTHSMLRNTVFARRGYFFKSALLQDIFSDTSWYKVDPSFTFDRLTRQESRNVETIQNLEVEFDSAVVAGWLKSHFGLDSVLLSGRDFELAGLDSEVRFSLNHFKWLPAEVLRLYLGATYGYEVPDPRLRSILAGLGVGGDLSWSAASRGFTNEARANVEYLQMRELYEKRDAITFTMPEGVTGFPAIGSEMYLYKTYMTPGGELHFGGLSFAQLPETLTTDGHLTSINTLLPLSGPKATFDTQAARQKLTAFSLGRNSLSAIEVLQLFFQNKLYAGFTDTVTFNQSDFQTPDELKPALATLGLDYLQLLRREIHARNGMTIGDPLTLRIFSACAWYKPRYTATLATQNRFPAGVKLTAAEVRNFSLLEGEMVYLSNRAYQRSTYVGSGYILVDLNQARARRVDFGWIGDTDSAPGFEVGAFREPGSPGIDFDVLSDDIKDRSGIEIYVSYGGAC